MAMSPADRQVEANGDVERIARELYEEFRRGSDAFHVLPPWDEQVDDPIRDGYRTVVRTLLRRDVIRVGHRPNSERPMEGQIRIEETETGGTVFFDDASHLSAEDKRAGADGK